MDGKPGENHSAELRRQSAEAKAEGIIAEGMGRLGWPEGDLGSRPRSDPGKLAMAARVRRETTLPVKWIAARLQLGALKSANAMLHFWMRAHDASASTQQPQPML